MAGGGQGRPRHPARARAGCVILAVAAVAACAREAPVYRPVPDPGPAPGSAAAASAAQGITARNQAPPASSEVRHLWATRCEACHGAQGRGDGMSARLLNPRPRSLADPAWQAAVDDARVATIIVQGGAVAGLSPSMPANPDLAARPDLVRGLVELIRGLRM